MHFYLKFKLENKQYIPEFKKRCFKDVINKYKMAVCFELQTLSLPMT